MAPRDMTMARFWRLGERGRPETFLIGGGLALLGIFALLSPALAGAMTLKLLGVLLLVAGAIEIFHGVVLHGEANWAAIMLSGSFSVLMGVLFLLQPATTLGATTFLVALYLFVGGLFRGVSAALERHPGWGWHLVGGAASLALGVLMVVRFPWATLPILGILVGLELLAHGLTVAASGVRPSLQRTPRSRAPRSSRA